MPPVSSSSAERCPLRGGAQKRSRTYERLLFLLYYLERVYLTLGG